MMVIENPSPVQTSGNSSGHQSSSYETITEEYKQFLSQTHLMCKVFPVEDSVTEESSSYEKPLTMQLPTFKPAKDFIDASDFVVRTFAARLRSGMKVIKHGRSPWSKSSIRYLYLNPDGRSVGWEPVRGDQTAPSSSKKPVKVDLTKCVEVRLSSSPDPQYNGCTGTSVLRRKCEDRLASDSFSLIFPTRTVDLTALSSEQCKILVDGFSALCLRLHVDEMSRKDKMAVAYYEDKAAAGTSSIDHTSISTNL